MNDLIVVRPADDETQERGRLSDVMKTALKNRYYDLITTAEELAAGDIRGRKLIFAVALGKSGINTEYYRMLRYIRLHDGCLDGCVAGAVIDGSGPLYTKAVSRQLVLSANMSGCAFPGKPLVEATGDLSNFEIIAKNLQTDKIGAYVESASSLVSRVVNFRKSIRTRPKLLVIHAGNATTSNTLELWNMVMRSLDADCREISLRDGEVYDCRGCSYETCLHLGEEGRCFYGGVVTREVYPALLESDGLVMVCPNYNDAISANLSAFINRLTALFRVNDFSDKRIFGVIVSGYSGSDIVAQQLISSLNMNKTFMLPPRFALMKTANAPLSIGSVPGIREDVYEYANRIMSEFRLA
ncbi:MAG: NAD(P)H-dependent oxidoreductase [Eubacteriaceae bacterium]|jgi:multimeric flavodoxin WrbA|nr:NAD(P)H-dependent oxidoreductase [Eubacteriaceae bacterium]